MKKTFIKVSDLPLRDGRVYHLDLGPEEMAKNIIIVGDPERVPFIADEFLERWEVDRFHRGLRTITGFARESGQRVSIVTSGMGTPSTEIVLNEIVALNEIDFNTLKRKEEYETINIIRVGTSGAIQPDTDLGTLIITDYVIGMDNTGLFYEAPYQDEKCRLLEEKVGDAIDATIPDDSRFKGKIQPYASRAHNDVVEVLEKEAKRLSVKYRRGVTVSNSGFFGSEGRAVSRIPLTVQDMDGVLASLETGIEGLRFENMEMESSFFLHFMCALGYRAGVVCTVIDNRRQGTFMTQYNEYIKDAVRVALSSLCNLGKSSYLNI